MIPFNSNAQNDSNAAMAFGNMMMPLQLAQLGQEKQRLQTELELLKMQNATAVQQGAAGGMNGGGKPPGNQRNGNGRPPCG